MFSVVTPSSHVNLPLAFPMQCDRSMHQQFNKWYKKEKKNKKKTLCILTCGTKEGCRLTSLVVCINVKPHDIRERNVTTRSEIWSKNICSLRFQDIREWVTLRELILQSLGCIDYFTILEVPNGKDSTEQGEPTTRYGWAGWVWEITSWSSRPRKITDHFRGIYEIL